MDSVLYRFEDDWVVDSTSLEPCWILKGRLIMHLRLHVESFGDAWRESNSGQIGILTISREPLSQTRVVTKLWRSFFKGGVVSYTVWNLEVNDLIASTWLHPESSGVRQIMVLLQCILPINTKKRRNRWSQVHFWQKTQFRQWLSILAYTSTADPWRIPRKQNPKGHWQCVSVQRGYWEFVKTSVAC